MILFLNSCIWFILNTRQYEIQKCNLKIKSNCDVSMSRKLQRYNIFHFQQNKKGKKKLEIVWNNLNVVIQSRNVVRLSVCVTKLFVLKGQYLNFLKYYYILSDNMRFSFVQNKNYDASILRRIYRYNIFLFPIRVMLEIDWSILNVVVQRRNVVRLSVCVTKLFVLKRVILELFEIIQQIIQCGDIIVGELFASLCDDIISCLDYTSNVVLTQNQVLPDVRHTKLTVCVEPVGKLGDAG
eukprot:TRINITY_DN8569_c0_g1_i6.p2 TRINITY_DN8569_c0_g1~~TRINITY_DN8569_c0_g1_i6.p2  ORF type:complete len:239 (-),score=-13.27 TRINITY_DN8569_c0_g1_i6:27-743(-)